MRSAVVQKRTHWYTDEEGDNSENGNGAERVEGI